MNGIDKIIARMEADTQAECADIAAQAAAEAEAILARYRAEADKLLREGEARCKVLEHEQVERLEGGSRLACRQRVLAEKQRMLDEAFARAADALLKLPRPEYIDLLASLAAENGQGGEALVFSAADRDTVGQAVVDAANGKKPARASPWLPTPGRRAAAWYCSGAAWRSTAALRSCCAGHGRRTPPPWPPCCLTERGRPFDKTEKGHGLSVPVRPHTRHGAPAADGTAAGAAADGTFRRGVRPAAERVGLRARTR